MIFLPRVSFIRGTYCSVVRTPTYFPLPESIQHFYACNQGNFLVYMKKRKQSPSGLEVRGGGLWDNPPRPPSHLLPKAATRISNFFSPVVRGTKGDA